MEKRYTSTGSISARASCHLTIIGIIFSFANVILQVRGRESMVLKSDRNRVPVKLTLIESEKRAFVVQTRVSYDTLP